MLLPAVQRPLSSRPATVFAFRYATFFYLSSPLIASMKRFNAFLFFLSFLLQPFFIQLAQKLIINRNR